MDERAIINASLLLGAGWGAGSEHAAGIWSYQTLWPAAFSLGGKGRFELVMGWL